MGYHDTEEEMQEVQAITPARELNISCRNCDKSFQTKPELMKHRKTKHSHLIRACTLYLANRCHRSVDECWYKHAQQEQAHHSAPAPTPAPTPTPAPYNVINFPALLNHQQPPDHMSTLVEMVTKMASTMAT